MKHYVGIDLGTTNSAICTYDGKNVRVWKSSEQNDVTPSAIFVGKRGERYVGRRAYDNAARSPGHAATLFKRHMGTSTPIKLPAVKLEMTPEECSAEVLRTLHGYLDEDMRFDRCAGTVITVPAMFNQMQRVATKEAAEMAGIGKVALMQEPVAAVMSAVRTHPGDAAFMIFDLGGGTLDIAIAESAGGHVSLLAHGGIQLCGGRDFDRLLLDSIVKPWLRENFSLPDDWARQERYRKLLRLAEHHAEMSKIALSAKESAPVQIGEAEIGCLDEEDEEIYLDLDVARDEYNRLIEPMVMKMVSAARAALEQSQMEARDLNSIIFIGGPMHYAWLRETVARELGVTPSMGVNYMTAVAEGAAVYAESVEWDDTSQSQKRTRGEKNATHVRLLYTARTPERKAHVKIRPTASVVREVEALDLETGWSSGRVEVAGEGATLELALTVQGDNRFKLRVFERGSPIADEEFVITRTAAVVEAIPASHSIGLKILDRIGGDEVMEWFLKKGDELPHRSSIQCVAGERIVAGSGSSLTFKLYEGESDEAKYNRCIGVQKISGEDFASGAIEVGDALECSCEMDEAGSLRLIIDAPSVGHKSDQRHNYYSHTEGQLDMSRDGERIISMIDSLLADMKEMVDSGVSDPLLTGTMDALKKAKGDALSAEATQEDVLAAVEALEVARQKMGELRKTHRGKVQAIELAKAKGHYEKDVREGVGSQERVTMEKAIAAAEVAVERSDEDAGAMVREVVKQNYALLWRQDWHVMGLARWSVSNPASFHADAETRKLLDQCASHVEEGRADHLRVVLPSLWRRLRVEPNADEMAEHVNIVRA